MYENIRLQNDSDKSWAMRKWKISSSFSVVFPLDYEIFHMVFILCMFVCTFCFAISGNFFMKCQFGSFIFISHTNIICLYFLFIFFVCNFHIMIIYLINLWIKHNKFLFREKMVSHACLIFMPYDMHALHMLWLTLFGREKQRRATQFYGEKKKDEWKTLIIFNVNDSFVPLLSHVQLNWNFCIRRNAIVAFKRTHKSQCRRCHYVKSVHCFRWKFILSTCVAFNFLSFSAIVSLSFT